MTPGQNLSNLLAFTNPWHIVGLLALFVVPRLFVASAAPRHRWRSPTLELLDSGILAVLLIFCIVRPFLIQAFLIPSGSMIPTFLEGDRIMANKLVYLVRPPHHSEIVVFHAPVWADPTGQDFIKRVIGLPGDRVSVHDRTTFRNGQPLDEPYIAEMPTYHMPESDYVVLAPGGTPIRLVEDGELAVPPGYILVLGDNRNASNDGHAWQAIGSDGLMYPCPFVPIENVIGKAMFKFWPPGRLGLVR